VAPLAVGQYLASREGGAHSNLVNAVGLWIFAEEDAGPKLQYAAAFGDVLGPLVQAALDTSHDHISME
jgi:hypothetical protein